MNQVCEKMKNINLEGNIIPISWYKHIKTQKGSIDHVAITLLADIIYWYRPIEIRDQRSGNIISYKQKFEADKLQKSYKEYANLFGYTKLQVKRAIDNLVRLQLLKREFRNIHSKLGLAINNVMYIEPIIDNIIKLTYRPTLLQSKDDPNLKVGATLLQSNHTPHLKVGTNTETTTDVSTKEKIFATNNHFPLNPSIDNIPENKFSGDPDKKILKTEQENKKILLDNFFEKEFWPSYPKRNGKRVGKKETKEYFLKHFKLKQIPQLKKAVNNYAISKRVIDGFAKDPIRFLKKDYWQDWIEPELDEVGSRVDAEIRAMGKTI